MVAANRARVVAMHLAPVAVFAGVLAHYALTSALTWTAFPLDDAWIHRVYARSFAFAGGFAYNPGDAQAGATSPLWVIVTAPAHWLDALGPRAPVVGTKLIGAVSIAGSLLLVTDIARRLTGSLTVGVLSSTLLAADARLGFAALSGMESPVLLLLTLAATRELLAGRCLWALVIAGLLPVTRPEGMLLVPLIAVPALWTRERDPRWPWALAAAAVPSALWAIHCKLATGHVLPTTFYVKSAYTGASSLTVLGAGLVQHGLLATPLPLIGGAAIALLLWRSRDRTAGVAGLQLIAAPLVYLVAVALTRDLKLHGFYWTRYLDPGVALLAVAIAIGAAALAGGLWGRAAVVVGVVAIVGSTPWVIGSHRERVERLISDSRAIESLNVMPAQWLAANTEPLAVIGASDAGASRYFADRRVVDLAGLNDAEIAFHRPSAAELAERLDWLVVFSYFASSSGLRPAFDRRLTVRVAQADYTVCDCPAQTEVWILRKPDGEPTPGRVARAYEAASGGDIAAARRILDEAIAANPYDPEPYERLAQLAQLQGRTEDALADYRRAVARSAGGPRELAGLGRLLADLGRTAEAIDSFERSLSAMDDPQVREHLAELRATQ